MPDTDSKITVLEVRLPKDNEFTMESSSSLLSNFIQSSKAGLFWMFIKKRNIIASLEIILHQGQVHFCIAIPSSEVEFFQSQILAQYSTASVKQSDDYLSAFLNDSPVHFTQLGLQKSYHYPLKNIKDFRDTDPLNSVLAPLARNSGPEDFFIYQILLAPSPGNWQSKINSVIQNGVLVDKERNIRQAHPDKMLFEQKILFPGLLTQINLLTNDENLLNSVASSFGAYTLPRGNAIKNIPPKFLKKKTLKKSILNRFLHTSLKTQILNVEEMSALWHFPTGLTQLPNIAWGQNLFSQPPENLPVADGATEEEKNQITFFAKTEFRNKDTIFGIRQGEDRRRHMYCIGKSGTGKTTMIANMAIDDIRKGKGVAVIDPHGDLCQTLLNYIPSNRINDCCYFNPADPEFVYPLNVLEVQNDSQKELVASSVISIFKKLYGFSWGPRLEHILRNALLTLVNTPDTNLSHVVEILTNRSYRQKVVNSLSNQTLKNFWINEFDKMNPKFQNEAISPILNKVGQFISSTNIRNTIAHNKSKINIQQIMDDKKILIADLSSGKLGEDNASLLGAMLITQIQLAAMNRVFQSTDERQDFYLYVDEFQNFATDAFIKIFSEARKFKLNLIVANQYMSQLSKEIQDSIFGNVGSLVSFVVGNQDAYILEKEFGDKFPAKDLVKLGRFQIICKLSIDQETTSPFYGYTLPPLSCTNQGRDKLISVSRQRWGKAK